MGIKGYTTGKALWLASGLSLKNFLVCLVIKISDSLVMKEKEIQLLLEEGNMEIDTNLDTNENEDAKFLIHDTDSNQIEKGDSDNDV
jgi:hypothetical protein